MRFLGGTVTQSTRHGRDGTTTAPRCMSTLIGFLGNRPIGCHYLKHQMPPRRRSHKDLPPNLYPAADTRDGVTRYRYRDPRTKKFHGLGSDKEAAIRDADALNEAIYGRLVYARRERIYLSATPEERDRLLELKGPRYRITSSIRFEVFNRDNFTCRYCGRSSPEVQLHVDHVHPVVLGGTNELSNLVTACKDCNLGKSDRTIYNGEKVQA